MTNGGEIDFNRSSLFFWWKSISFSIFVSMESTGYSIEHKHGAYCRPLKGYFSRYNLKIISRRVAKKNHKPLEGSKLCYATWSFFRKMIEVYMKIEFPRSLTIELIKMEITLIRFYFAKNWVINFSDRRWNFQQLPPIKSFFHWKLEIV